MRITSLKLANVRAIETAEFRFQPGFNLIVGVNGVGKSTVLDALRICLSRILRLTPESRSKAMSFRVSDIRNGFPFLDAAISFSIGDDNFHFTRREWRETFAVDDDENLKKLRREILDSERLRDRARNLLRELEESHGVSDSDVFDPPMANLMVALHIASVAPNGVFFSPHRSVVPDRTTKSGAAGGKSAAYAKALDARPIDVAKFAAWMRVQEALAKEQNVAKRHLKVLRSAVERFLPSYENLRPADEKSSRLLIDKDGITLDVRQLSDGERGVLVMVLDLARRLAQANPEMKNPAADAEAVVLIDEIDLHLHPQWQRQIAHHLTETFPRCQFIATTHSPQVIGEVEHDRIHIISDGQVYSPTHSFGVDSSRVLEEIMHVNPRTREIQELLTKVSREVGKQQYENARELLVQLVKKLGENDPEVTRIRTLLEFMEGEE